VRDIKRRYKVPKNVWIVKPGENTNRGNGINVSSSLPEIKSLVSHAGSGGFDAGGEVKEKTFIVQKYIDHPLLIHNRKFDFRCYGLMTSINGHLKGYFYEDCYIRTSCKEFDIQNLDNKYIHLTNDAVQKNS
jgi:tubulin---tyrosine ligase